MSVIYGVSSKWVFLERGSIVRVFTNTQAQIQTPLTSLPLSHYPYTNVFQDSNWSNATTMTLHFPRETVKFVS